MNLTQLIVLKEYLKWYTFVLDFASFVKLTNECILK